MTFLSSQNHQEPRSPLHSAGFFLDGVDLVDEVDIMDGMDLMDVMDGSMDLGAGLGALSNDAAYSALNAIIGSRRLARCAGM